MLSERPDRSSFRLLIVAVTLCQPKLVPCQDDTAVECRTAGCAVACAVVYVGRSKVLKVYHL